MHLGPHDSFVDLYEEYPVKPVQLFNRLVTLCSAIAHWNTTLGQVGAVTFTSCMVLLSYGQPSLGELFSRHPFIVAPPHWLLRGKHAISSIVS